MVVDVISLKFDVLNFPKSYQPERQRRGRQIYGQEGVEILEVNKIDNENYKIISKVRGSYSKYDVNLNICKNMIQKYNCTCEDYASGYICKHILATTFEILNPHGPNTKEGRQKLQEEIERRKMEIKRRFELQKQEEERKREYQRKYATALTTINRYKSQEEFSQLYESNSNTRIDIDEIYQRTQLQLTEKDKNVELATSIKLEPRIEIYKGTILNISFKIGESTKYILKNIEEFGEAFIKKETLHYGKKLKFIASKDNFCIEDQPMLKFILDYSEMIRYNKKVVGEYYYYSSNYSEKFMSIMEEKIDEFFEITKNKNIYFSSYKLDEGYYEVSLENLNINLILEEKNGECSLKINLKKYAYIKSNQYIYIFLNKKIYKIENNEDISSILNIFEHSNEILIPQDRYAEFAQYVFPKIEKYIEKNNLPDTIVKEGLVVNRLASKIYLDLDNKDNIIMELKFCYNEYEFNILDKKYEIYVQENNIIRNIPEERNVLKRIFTDGFEFERGKKYFILNKLDAIYEFLSDKINGYMNDFEVLVTDKFKNKKVRQPQISNVPIRIDEGLLEIDISKIDINMNEIKDILKNYNIKKKYYKLKNGDFLSLEKSENLEFLNDISNTFDINYDKLNNGIIKLPINRSIYLEKLLDKNKEISTTKNDEFTKLINNIEDKNFSDNIKINKNFENVLRDYQKTGYQWLKTLEYYKFGGILADDMGLGKTLQVIALLNDELENKNHKTSIVICPSSLVLNWKAEIEKWCENIRTLIIRGDAETRKVLIDSYDEYDLLITSYDLLKRDVFEYEGKQFKFIIADEAQYIKNSVTQNATALKSLEGEIKFALTGTPIENSISELWSIFDFIMPDYLYTHSKFKKKFEEPILKLEDEKAMERLKAMISPFILRRVKKDVLTELPEKNITIMKNEMTSEQEKLYLSYLMQTQKEVAEELENNGFEKSKFKILMLLTRLRQICCHPSLFIDNYSGESGKLNQCIDLILDAIESKHKILLFSSYTSMFEIIEEKLSESKIKYFKLTGSTDVNKRVEMVEEFNKNDDIKIFLISLKAGGTGLNLTGADVVIHYDPWWNVSTENQATDRAYRIGQKNSVQVYKLITTNSIEEKINKIQERKAQISEQVLSTEQKFINKLSKEEIMDLFEV